MRGAIMARDAVIDTLWSRRLCTGPHTFWAVSHAPRLRKESSVFAVGGFRVRYLFIARSHEKRDVGGPQDKSWVVDGVKKEVKQRLEILFDCNKVMCASCRARVPNAISRE